MMASAALGKFRKPIARRSQKTPYDRPLKNPRPVIGEDRGGWLSKLVDTSQRLITYTAHKLFASVFRKSLETPLQSPQQFPERDLMEGNKLSMKNDVIRVQEDNACKNGFIDLEKVLKEKTFTRAEADRLTTLLRLKAADSSTVKSDQRNEASVARYPYPPSHKRHRAHPDSGIMNALVSTPPGSSRLAKAYKVSRPSEVTPMPGSHVRRPMENSFVTPRSRGRSAIYIMARTPYSWPQSTVKASPSPWAESLPSTSRRGFQSGLKRRSLVLDTDIRSVGPVRRVLQKSNLSSRSLGLPVSESPLYVRASGGRNMTHTSKDVGDSSGSDFNLVSSMSRELASNILQQVDKTVSPKKKKSPSILKSLKNVEASLDNIPEKKANLPSSSHQKPEKNLRETGAREFLPPSGKTGDAVDDTSKTGSSKDQETCVNDAYPPLTSSVEEHPPKRRGFRMIVDEDDLLELSDDDHSEPSTLFEVAEKQKALKVKKGVDISMPRGEKPLTSSEVMASTSYIPNGDVSQCTSNGSLETGRSHFSALPIEGVQQSNMPSEPTPNFIQGIEKSSNSPAKLTSEGGDISREEHTKVAAVFPSTFSSPPASTGLLNQNTGQTIVLTKNYEGR